ncbi:hypothetical protein [Streptomyces sp. ST2-7A]|uniref:hypothetical protein n=1 Tax=Streptomyces sp. ST2-7A TaxID=2907214 RepID=UPI001F29CCAB|nr:hypothetical protein [Streptomyces sp. ST2-7A]MCE7080153.1 hypothetical protein [Streptomyces sp. ST2-7A]
MPHTLTVGRLVQRLRNLDPALPVFLAINPDWPFAHTIAGIVKGVGPAGPVIYIAENGQEDHLPAAVRDELNWNNA